ncbi:nucleotidyltransferase substrate binding protein [Xanthomonas campestris pv. incanae]|uniref:nucleotidyltransferase substrate binding protein n=1 Tax=Xanthomonas campestris TaxID=339 RepID=UPI002368AF1C|nr:nucleotidyltransferase substrate binding protein [Xanthomonas campestris]WDJ84920.1 nucleotidyltransferase substrate binding protein [Xanthomonas campestris pv. incanae]WDK25993.1 nucleotidyltransferase substrate binding protein [Xanthomonas campestris pv. incanae]
MTDLSALPEPVDAADPVDCPARWEQRADKFAYTLVWARTQIGEATFGAGNLADQGLIKVFEICYDMAWHALNEYLRWQGLIDLHGPRDTFREAFARGVVGDGELWMEMCACRALAAKSHHGVIARELACAIVQRHLPLLESLAASLKAFRDERR